MKSQIKQHNQNQRLIHTQTHFSFGTLHFSKNNEDKCTEQGHETKEFVILHNHFSLECCF